MRGFVPVMSLEYFPEVCCTGESDETVGLGDIEAVVHCEYPKKNLRGCLRPAWRGSKILLAMMGFGVATAKSSTWRRMKIGVPWKVPW